MHPGKICCEDITLTLDKTYLVERPGAPDAWMDRQLKPGMVEGTHYVALEFSVGKFLVQTYQVNS